jgi:sigma-B regulation protein RsbU (phosphoserine phosphatase)
MNDKNKQRRISAITIKIIAVNCISILVCFFVLSFFNYSFYRTDSISFYNNKALSVAETIASYIDGDILRETMRSGEKNEYWHRQKAAINNTLARMNLAYLYILDSVFDGYVTYYMEAETEGSKLTLGDTDDVIHYADEMFQTILTGQSTVSGIYDSDVYGKLVSAFAAIHDSYGNIAGVVGVDVCVERVFNAERRWEFISRLLLVVVLCVISPIIFQLILLQRMVGRPVKELTAASAKLGSGNLEVSLSIKTKDEIEELADTFAKMAAQLQDYITNLTQMTGEKERFGAELDVATKIQASMLPCIFPAFPERKDFDLYASMEPAKEVGGDFYDFFLIGENTLVVVMADVSGKGVPAALFMIITKTLIKNNAQYGKSPKGVFETVNNLLCENNEAAMFVTAFMGYFDIPTGRFTYVNAGHNPPLIKRGKCFEWLKEKPGFILAGMDDMSYKQYEVTLKPGDELFLYTDGITETVNQKEELFTDLRLLETANRYLDLPLKEFTESIKYEIDKFADGAEQADDITMLVLRYKGLKEGD